MAVELLSGCKDKAHKQNPETKPEIFLVQANEIQF
jgi:hypothetical protein